MPQALHFLELLEVLQIPPGTNDIRMSFLEASRNGASAFWVGWFYRFGTADLTATGQRLTHDSTFTRIRKQEQELQYVTER